MAQSIRRVPEDERYDSFGALQGLPWKPIPDRPDSEETLELPAPVELSGDSPQIIPPIPTQVVEGERQIRRCYVTKSDLEKYGFTEGCPACDKERAGVPRGGINHAHETEYLQKQQLHRTLTVPPGTTPRENA